MQFQKRYSQGLVLDTFYTLSKALDDCDSDYGTCSGVAPDHRSQPEQRHAPDTTGTRRSMTSATYELPVGKGRHFLNHNKVLDFLIGGYNLAWVQTIDDRQSVRFQLHQQPLQLLSDQHRQLTFPT